MERRGAYPTDHIHTTKACTHTDVRTTTELHGPAVRLRLQRREIAGLVRLRVSRLHTWQNFPKRERRVFGWGPAFQKLGAKAATRGLHFKALDWPATGPLYVPPASTACCTFPSGVLLLCVCCFDLAKRREGGGRDWIPIEAIQSDRHSIDANGRRECAPPPDWPQPPSESIESPPQSPGLNLHVNNARICRRSSWAPCCCSPSSAQADNRMFASVCSCGQPFSSAGGAFSHPSARGHGPIRGAGRCGFQLAAVRLLTPARDRAKRLLTPHRSLRTARAHVASGPWGVEWCYYRPRGCRFGHTLASERH